MGQQRQDAKGQCHGEERGRASSEPGWEGGAHSLGWRSHCFIAHGTEVSGNFLLVWVGNGKFLGSSSSQRRAGRLLAPGLGLTGVILGQDGLGDALQQLLGEDAQQLPADVQRLEDAPVLVGAWGRSREDSARGWAAPGSAPSRPVPSHAAVPWVMNCFSNFCRNSRYSKSSADSASSPTTAFIACTSLPMA